LLDLEKSKKQSILKRLKTDPVYHIERIQGVTTLQEYQKRIANSVAVHERTVISASHDIGKTWTMSKIVLWFGSTFKGSKIITTAPTFNQVKRLLWSEIRSGFAQSKVPLGGEMLVTEWKINSDWFAIGFTSRNEATAGEGQGNASTFQGFHAQYILVVFDEATGIPPSIWKQVEGLLTSGFVRFVAIGNPTSKSCDFYKCFSDPAYHKIKLSCFDSPNFPANGIRNMDDLRKEYDLLRSMSQDDQQKRLASYEVVGVHFLTLRWVLQMCLKHGLEHPLVVSKCFGQFPDEDEYGLIKLSTVEVAQNRTYEFNEETDRISIGVDVARFGSDKTVITVFKGRQQTLRKHLTKKDSNFICGEIVQIIHLQKSHDIHVVVDATGVGSGVVDILRERRSENTIPDYVEIREVHFGGSPGAPEDEDAKKRFANLKARMYFQLAEDLKEELCLLLEDIYLEELPTIQYRFDSKGRWIIESKEEYRARTGKGSPDDSDSLALANFGRYSSFGIGQFTEDLLSDRLSTIALNLRGMDQW
jgi:phage terminase large subunit